MYKITPAALLLLAVEVSGTSFLNHGQLLNGIEDPQWFEDNIPFIDIPDSQIQDVYYYRWETYKEHLVYTGAQYGYFVSEFLQPVSYGAPYGGVVAAAGHHINEGRWLRDLRYGQNAVNYWLAGPGQFPKPMTDEVNNSTSDWAHEYSFWAASSVWRQYLVTGDQDFVVGQLDNLVTQYRGWDNHFNDTLGLYWQVPVWDATEYSASSYESSDPYHGGAGYRPTINSYQYGDARAIANIAALSGDQSLVDEYNSRADALQKALQSQLWDTNASFFKDMPMQNNPSDSLLDTREIMGYIPWMFDVPSTNSDLVAFNELTDPDGFYATYGPTTAEQRSRWFMYQAANCCRWDGPSWPYATAQTLTALENVLNDYSQTTVNSTMYTNLLSGYAATQYKNGSPYVAEAHYPSQDEWIYDTEDHSEDYNHSTFVDNILAGLMGLRGQANDSLIVNPLVPSSWDHFAVENAAYHGHNITVIWDSDGSNYGQGSGMKVYVDDQVAGSRSTVGMISVDVGAASVPSIDDVVNIAANGQLYPQLTSAFASYTFTTDNASRILDGIVWRVGIPENTRWTSYNSPNPSDYVGVDLQRDQAVSDVRLFFYDDGVGVHIPSSYDLQYYTGSTWETVPNQSGNDLPTGSGAETRITFPTITTSQLRVEAPNPGNGNGWGLSEFEVWTPAIFKIQNDNSQKLMGVANESTANSADIQQYDDNGTPDHLWQFIPAAGGWYKIKNYHSGLLLAVENESTADSAQLQQYQDSGTPDQLWRVDSQGNGLFFIRNKNSNLLVGVSDESTADGADIVQFENNGTPDHLWSLLPAVPSDS